MFKISKFSIEIIVNAVKLFIHSGFRKKFFFSNMHINSHEKKFYESKASRISIFNTFILSEQ